jgi:hypothetical protein
MLAGLTSADAVWLTAALKGYLDLFFSEHSIMLGWVAEVPIALKLDRDWLEYICPRYFYRCFLDRQSSIIHQSSGVNWID